MATMALPIRELERSVSINAEKARAETERVATYSGSPRPSMGTICKIAVTSVMLKWLFNTLVKTQDKLIKLYQETDVTHVSDESLTELARNLRRIVEEDREILAKANALGAEVRVMWDASLRRIADQVEHLDSIAEALEVECDPEASLLLAMVADQFAIQDAKPCLVE